MKNKIEEWLNNGVAAEIIQKRYNKVTVEKIAKEYGAGVATIYNLLKRIREQGLDTNQLTKSEESKVVNEEDNIIPSEYDILYENRKEVVKLFKQGISKVEIAKQFNVSDIAVFEFFDNRVKFNSSQINDMRTMYKNDISFDEIAKKYNTKPQIVASIFQSTYTATKEVEEHVNIVMEDFNCVSEFNKYLHWIEQEYKESQDCLSKTDKKIQDVLHQIEFDEYQDNEAISLVNEVKDLRNNRRDYKDFIILVTPLIEFIQQDKNRDILRRLSEIASQVNNQAKKLNNRIYRIKEE